MRLALLFAFAPLLAACAPSVTDACDAYAQAFCSQNLACLTGNDLSNFQAQYGATVDACMVSYENFNHCNADQSPCPVGLNYDTNQVEQCASDYQASSCLDVSQPGFQPASCAPAKVCHD